MVDGGRAGKMLAVYRKAAGTAASLVYNLQHDLGVVPAWCILLGVDNASTPGTVLAGNWHEWDKWTASEVRMSIATSAGNRAGATMWFLIGGER
jgi:hypothetical protein